MSELVGGLCSVTFRDRGVDEVARLATSAGLRAVEWGADVHVPPGDTAAADRARSASAAAGLACPSYGSYLLADGDASPDLVARVLESAVALGATNVRVWTPFGVEPGSAHASEVAAVLATVAEAAAARDLTVSLEFHAGTLTATVESTRALLDAVDAPNLYASWQPPYWLLARSAAADAADVVALAPRLAHLHVYEWSAALERRPLETGVERWRAVLPAARAATEGWPGPRCAFLEFVTDDDPAALARDAAVLLGWLREGAT